MHTDMPRRLVRGWRAHYGRAAGQYTAAALVALALTVYTVRNPSLVAVLMLAVFAILLTSGWSRARYWRTRFELDRDRADQATAALTELRDWIHAVHLEAIRTGSPEARGFMAEIADLAYGGTATQIRADVVIATMRAETEKLHDGEKEADK